MKIIGRSKALHSTWFFLPTYKLLLDCGEGACLELGTLSSDVQYIFISHMHVDHWAGLISLARFQKRVQFKDKTKRMATVFYHRDFLPKINDLRNFLESKENRLFFKYQEIEIDKKFHLRDNFYIKPFVVDHTAPYYKQTEPAMGIHLLEKRKRLNPKIQKKKLNIEKKYKNAPQKAKEEFTKFIIKEKKDKGENTLIEHYNNIMLSYCGDSKPVDHHQVLNTEILMHESTFFDEKDLEAAHSSVSQAVEVARKSKCKKLILYHFSERYYRERFDYIKEATKIARKKIKIPIYIAPVNKLFIKDV